MSFLDPQFLITTLGLVGVWAIIFAESGLLIGFFLPGDSLLFTAGFLASAAAADFNIWLLAGGAAAAAILGDSVGYWLGARFGRPLFERPDSRWFRREYVTRTEVFYARHGKKTIILARFVPIVRTFAPVLAGVGRMNYRIFLSYNLIGGLIWGAGVPLLGYFLGRTIPGVDRFLLPIIILIILTSFLPALPHFFTGRKK